MVIGADTVEETGGIEGTGAAASVPEQPAKQVNKQPIVKNFFTIMHDSFRFFTLQLYRKGEEKAIAFV